MQLAPPRFGLNGLVLFVVLCAILLGAISYHLRIVANYHNEAMRQRGLAEANLNKATQAVNAMTRLRRAESQRSGTA